MIHLFVNALAVNAGGGLTYIRNVVPHFAARSDVRITVALNSTLRQEFRGFSNIDFVESEAPAARRFWHEHSALPGLIRRSGANILLSTGNFAIRNSPVPQILLSRNSIYTSADFYSDLRRRHEYQAWLETRLRAILARRSVSWADATVAPSEAFAAELRQWTGKQVLAIHHGFDHEAFSRDSTPLAPAFEQKLAVAKESLSLLFVSHYNYYRNFETLIRALPILRECCVGRPVRLLLTCSLVAGENPGNYRPEAAANMVKQLGVSDMVVELGAVPYHQLHHLYRRADLYVTPAYAETFAHPLVEAMASGLPVIASDLAVHREICGDAGAYFPRFSPEALAECVLQLGASPETSQRMSASGLERSRQFSWKTHVERIIELSETLIDSSAALGGN